MMTKLASLAATVLLLGVTGCDSGSASQAHSKVAPPQAIAQVARGTRVTVLSEAGDFAQVRTSEGDEYYVPASMLQQKSTLKTDDSYSHVLSAPAHAYESPPAVPVEMPEQTMREVMMERVSLNQLYLSEKTKREVIAPGSILPTYEGETCWPAAYCTNPACPAKDEGKNGQPFLFINPHGSGDPSPLCPACKPLWESQRKDPATQARYRKYVKSYVLPGTARRLKELQAQRRKSLIERRAQERRETAQDRSG